MAAISLTGVSKTFTDGTVAIAGLTLEIGDGELLAVLGPSGCGKSTVLRIVAGLEVPTEGQVAIGDQVVTEVAPGARDLAIVFQDYALYPHLTVFDNMAFPLKAKRMKRRAIDQRVREVAALLGIEALLHRRPRALSGGERQRVAMGRAIVRSPSAFLMDEPLSNLDAKLRVQLRSEIRTLHRELGATFLYVTHDQTEALTIGDRVAVMRRGRLQQVDDPQQVYDFPANLFVAGFIGTPPMNLLLAPVEQEKGHQVARVGNWRFPLPEGVQASEIVVGIRPEHLGVPGFLHGYESSSAQEVTVLETETLGSVSLLHFPIEVRPVLLRDDASSSSFVVGDSPTVVIAAADAQARIAAGSRVAIAADVSRARFFDAQTGAAVGQRRPVSTTPCVKAL